MLPVPSGHCSSCVSLHARMQLNLIRPYASSRPQRHSAHDCGMHVTCQAHCRLYLSDVSLSWREVALCLATQYFRPTSPVVTAVCDVLRSACLSVCLFNCTLAYVKYHASKFHQIFYTCYLWPRLGPPLTAMSAIEDDARFSHNTANGPVSKRTFRPVRQRTKLIQKLTLLRLQ